MLLVSRLRVTTSRPITIATVEMATPLDMERSNATNTTTTTETPQPKR